MRTVRSLILQLVLSTALIAGAWAAWQARDSFLPAGEAQKARKPIHPDGVPVVTAHVAEGEDTVVVEAVGTGRARRSVTLKPESAGRVVEVPMQAGRPAAADDVLLRLDDLDQRLALELAEARHEEAIRVTERYEALQSSAVTSRAVLTEALTERAVTRIEVEKAEAELADRVVRAPFAGVPGIPEVEVGDRVDTDTVIASFDDRSEILVEFALPETWIARLEEGAAVEARTPSRPGERFEGTVDMIDSRVDPVSRSVRVRVAIPNGDDRLIPGASFTVVLRLDGPRHPQVPELALQFAREGPYVWRVREGAAQRVPVRLVRRNAGTVLVDGPIGAGDLVVVEGVQRLHQGREVNVVGSSDLLMADRDDAE